MGRIYSKPRASIAATPIIDRTGGVVGWTREPPSINSVGTMHHAQAEALLHGPVRCTYVQIVDHAQAVKAGAPSHWAEPWRCLGIVPTEPEKISG